MCAGSDSLSPSLNSSSSILLRFADPGSLQSLSALSPSSPFLPIEGAGRGAEGGRGKKGLTSCFWQCHHFCMFSCTRRNSLLAVLSRWHKHSRPVACPRRCGRGSDCGFPSSSLGCTISSTTSPTQFWVPGLRGPQSELLGLYTS